MTTSIYDYNQWDVVVEDQQYVEADHMHRLTEGYVTWFHEIVREHEGSPQEGVHLAVDVDVDQLQLETRRNVTEFIDSDVE